MDFIRFFDWRAGAKGLYSEASLVNQAKLHYGHDGPNSSEEIYAD
jgi:hypothetical protein